MSTESIANGSVLAPRAALAQLSLELRASMHEVTVAEAEFFGIDQDAALARVRARLAPLIEARRRKLDEALAEAEAEAAVAIAVAREMSTSTDLVIEPNAVSVYDAMARSETTDADRSEPVATGAPTFNIIIDAAEFARVIASVLGEHLAGRGVVTPERPVAPQPAMKHARHLDVVLVGIATLIMFVILAAWIG